MSERRDTSVGDQAGVEEKCSKDLSRMAAKGMGKTCRASRESKGVQRPLLGFQFKCLE